MKTILAILFAASCFAGDTNVTVPLLKIGDTIYTNATIRKANPQTVLIRHDGGFGGSLAITNLPEPWRSKFYDTNEIAKAAKLEALAREREEKRKNSIQDAAIEKARVTAWEKLKRNITVRVESVSADGISGVAILSRNIYGRPPPGNALQQIGGAVRSSGGIGPIIGREERDGQSVFVSNFNGNVADGQRVSVAGWQKGTKTLNGKTLEVWECTTPKGFPPPDANRR